MNVNCTFVPTRVPFMAIACVAISMRDYSTRDYFMHDYPRVAQDELHEMCIFHATRKHGPRSHVTGLFKYLSCCHACKMKL